MANGCVEPNAHGEKTTLTHKSPVVSRRHQSAGDASNANFNRRNKYGFGALADERLFASQTGLAIKTVKLFYTKATYEADHEN